MYSNLSLYYLIIFNYLLKKVKIILKNFNIILFIRFLII